MNEIDVQDLYQKLPQLNDHDIILDVRTHEEFQDVHLTPSRHIPLDQIATHIDELSSCKTIYVLCRSGRRSETACQFLSPLIEAELYNITGGILDWIDNDFPVETSENT